MREIGTSRTGLVVLLTGLLLAARVVSAGGEARYFKVAAQDDFLAGTLAGIAVDPLGSLSLADRVDRVADLEEPFLFAVAEHPRGWVVGTGNSGKVLLVGRGGEIETLYQAPEPEVFAVHVDRDGSVYAGTSPQGKVYRISAAGAEVFFDPGETYIWSLAGDNEGRLLVATGTEGRLYRVSRSGTGEVLFDGDDTHLRSMKVLADGSVLVGSAGEGLILRIGSDGRVRTLYDGIEPEVVALTEGPDGSCYAALLASEASLVDLAGSKTAASRAAASTEGEDGDDSDGNDEPKTTVTTSSSTGAAFVGSRPAGFKGSRSAVLRIAPSGLVERVWEFENETVYSLGWHRGRLWVGTGLEGKLFSLQERRMVLEKDVGERQIVSIAPGEPGPVFATTNAAAVFAVGSEGEPEGTYTSAVLDASQVSRFGTLRWRGELPPGGTLEFAARSGMSASPDRTWSDWSADATGPEVALGDVPAGRYLQWRASLVASNGDSPVVREVTISYVQENLAPRITSFTAMSPGEVIVPASFNPGQQVFEPENPARGGIFTTLKAAKKNEGRRKTLWKRGFRTLTWAAEDPNADELRFELLFRRDGSSGDWLPIADHLDETHYSFDTTVLPDGAFRFLLRAVDRSDLGATDALEAEQISESVVVDNSAPVLVSARREGDAIEVRVRDQMSPVRSARVSVDAGEWEPIDAADGLLDGHEERLRVPMPDAGSMLLLQVMDTSFNMVTFDLSKELP